MCLVEDHVERLVLVLDGVREDLPERDVAVVGVLDEVGLLAELVRVDEVDRAGLQGLLGVGLVEQHQVTGRDAVGALDEAALGLRVERRVLGDPQHDRRGIGLDVELIAAMQQGLDDGGRDNGLAGAGRRRQCERGTALPAVPVLAGVAERGEDLADGLGLVVLQRERIGQALPVLIWNVRR